MARAYIVFARKDIHPNRPQILDLYPNTSQRNSVLDGAGQTGYLSWIAQNDTMAAHTNDGGVLKATGTYYGLATYLAARIDDITTAPGQHLTPTAPNCNTIATAILARVKAGSALTLAGINAAIQVTLATSGIVGTGTSTATVEEILRIVSGEVFKVSATDALSGAAGIFLGTAGAFVVPVTTNNVVTYPSDWRHVRTFINTGSLHLSRYSGHLSKLADAAYVWSNASFTYGAAGTALWIDETHLTTTTGRAVVVYDAAGNVITN